MRKLREYTCTNCTKLSNSREKDASFCSKKCRCDFSYKKKVKDWLTGKSTGLRGKTATAVYIKTYLISTRGEKCEQCSWCERNSYTNKIPIELDHIDGNFENNLEENLKLLCPSCHSLTGTFRSLNKKGRPRKKYY
jgi:hypothetical protein